MVHRLRTSPTVLLSLLMALAMALVLSPQHLQAQNEPVTEDDVISGTMDIQFLTRTNLDNTGSYKPGSPAEGVEDKYTFTLSVAKTTEFSGQIRRRPTLYSKLLQWSKQAAALTYDVDLAVLNPQDLKQKKTVGKWVGTVPIDPETGVFNLDGGKALENPSPLRIQILAIGRAPAFTDHFSGKLIGKAIKKETLASRTYKRVVGGKTVEMVVKKVDPMSFENIALAKGPAEIYPRTIVNGRLDYDYETGNYLTDGIRFRYNLDGTDHEDIVTGSIRWVEDPDRATNGKGYYEFNLRFNEEKNRAATDEGSAFGQMSDEDAFFAVDNSIPTLTGKIAYVDTMAGDSELPASSKVTYNLHANKLSKQQIMNFLKLWLIAVGPTNDE